MDIAASKENMNAEQFAHDRHERAGKRYAGGPYKIHLKQVVDILIAHGFGEPFISAGWLHDVLEDTPTTYEELVTLFGADVADLVEAVTGRGESRKERNRDAYGKIGGCRLDARSLKLADRIANSRACLLGGSEKDLALLKMYRKEWPDFAAALRGGGDERLWIALRPLMGPRRDLLPKEDPAAVHLRAWSGSTRLYYTECQRGFTGEFPTERRLGEPRDVRFVFRAIDENLITCAECVRLGFGPCPLCGQHVRKGGGAVVVEHDSPDGSGRMCLGTSYL